MKLIIGPLTSEQLKIVYDDLVSRDYRCKTVGQSFAPEDTAIRINHDPHYPERCEFRVGNYEKYDRYVTTKNKDYSDDLIYDFNHYTTYMMASFTTNTEYKKVVQNEVTDAITITKQNVLNTYKLSSNELQIFMRNLFGESLFKETTYKIGDWFEYQNNKYVLTKINKDVVTLIDTKTYENYSLSKSVRDMYKITENELRSLIGVNYDKFKLIK